MPAQRVGRLILVDPLVKRRRPNERLSRPEFGHKKRQDLDRQVARLTGWATTKPMSVDEVVTEIGSSMNEKRRKLARVFAI